jgi:ParB family chromosome partitioning protein
MLDKLPSKAELPSPQRAKSWRAIADIIVGERHRKDMGDISALAASIREVGLLHPIVITPDGELIAGERRLRAVESLGCSEISATVVDLDSVVSTRSSGPGNPARIPGVAAATLQNSEGLTIWPSYQTPCSIFARDRPLNHSRPTIC